MQEFVEALKWLGLDPALVGLGALLAVALLYARGMVRKMNSEASYALAVLFGLFGAWVLTEGFGKGFARNALSLTCVVLLGQKLLQQLAKKYSWLPQDNEWVKP